MKKLKIIPISFIIIGIILVITGAILIQLGVGVSEFDTNEQPKSLSFENPEELYKIKAECDIGDVIIKSGDTLKVEYKNIVEEKLYVSFTDGVLSVKYKAKKWHEYIRLGSLNENITNGRITITVPEGYVDSLELKSGVGDFRLEEITANNTVIDSGIGEFEINNCKFTEKLDADTGIGELDIKNSEINNLILDNGIGDSKLEHCTLKGDSEIDNGIGDVKMKLTGKYEDYSFSLDNGIGDIKVEGLGNKNYTSDSSDSITIENGIGDVKIDFE